MKKKTTCKVCKIEFIIKHRGNPDVYCSRNCQYQGQKVDFIYPTKESKIKKLTQVFNERIIKDETGCWIWSGTKINLGYGTLTAAGIKILSHRASWWIYNGSLDDNMHVCHNCDNPSCVNPKHLFLGTDKDNVKDMWDKNRQAGQFNKGIIAHNRKITEDIAKEIKQLRLNKTPCKEICNRLNISLNIVKDISRGKTWKHI